MTHSQIIRERRYRRANPQLASSPAPGAMRTYPESIEAAEVLIIVSHPPAPGWWETRGKLGVDLLAEAGISAACVTMPGEIALSNLIEDWGVKLVINRAMLLEADATARLATRFPHTKFVAANQSSYQFLSGSGRDWDLHWDFWRLIETRENCYLTSPDERRPLAQIRPDLAHKIPWIPNPSRIPDWQPRPLGDPPLVTCINAGRPLKNNVNQILGYALARKKRPMRLLISVRNEWQKLKMMCDALKIEAEFRPWLEWPEYMQRISQADLCLQASFTESYNYVALEHMLLGVPVVGSDAIRYIPYQWRAETDTPAHISDKILARLDDWEAESPLARGLAVDFAETRNRQFQDFFAGALS